MQVTISRNAKYNSIELRFSEKPATTILDRLREDGWRWFRRGAFWYNAKPTSQAFAESIKADAEGTPAPAPAPAPERRSTRSQFRPDAPAAPWDGATVEQEHNWYGTRVHATARDRSEDSYSGTITRVLNGGKLLEVKRDGWDIAFRVDAARITPETAAPAAPAPAAALSTVVDVATPAQIQLPPPADVRSILRELLQTV